MVDLPMTCDRRAAGAAARPTPRPLTIDSVARALSWAWLAPAIACAGLLAAHRLLGVF